MTTGARRLLVVGCLALSLPGRSARAAEIVVSGELNGEVRAMVAAPDPYVAMSSRPDATGRLHVYPADEVDGLLRLDLDWRFGPATTRIVDVRADEVWLRWAKGSGAITFGRQVVRWGNIDEFGVADVINPQRLFDLGAEAPERKIGVWALSGEWSAGPARFEVIVMPWHVRSRFASGGPFVTGGLPAPQQREFGRMLAELAAAQSTSAAAPPTAAVPAAIPQQWADRGGGTDPDAIQFGVRAIFSASAGDIGLFGGRLLDQIGTPVVSVDQGVLRVDIEYPGIYFVGVDLVFPVGDWSFAGESVYFHSEDADGTDPAVRNPTLHSAAEIRWQFHPDWEVRLGIQDEQIFRDAGSLEYGDEQSLPNPVGSPFFLIDDHMTHSVLRYTFGDQLSQLTAAWAWAYESSSHFFNGEADFGITDAFRIRIGGQLFAGSKGTGFERLRELGNVFAGFQLKF